jgi:hypothetical protein
MPLGINPYAWNPPADVLALRSSSCRSQREVKGTRALQPARILSSTHALTELAMYAGQGFDAIRDVPPAGELVARLWKECLDAN